MKKGLLLTGAALCAMSMMAQDVNYAPVNWRFDQMEVGSAESIFLKDMASAAWNCKAPFRSADNGNGGVGLANNGANGESADNPEGFANQEATLAYFEDFYTNARIVATNIVDGDNRTPENILCLIGKDAAATYPGGQARTNSFGSATLFWLSGNENSGTTPAMEVGKNYRLTIDFRVIMPESVEVDQVDFTLATSAYDGIDQNTGLGDGGYRTGSVQVYPSTNDYWNRAIFDFMVFDNNAADYKELPFVIKMWLGDMADNSVILMRTFKLEQIDEIDPANVPCNATDYPTYSDEPGTVSVENVGIQNDAIVTVANGAINVVGAKSSIEVYNIAGAKVATVAAPSDVEAIDLDMNGVFVVKVDGVAQKVIL